MMGYSYVVLRGEPTGLVIASSHRSEANATKSAKRLATQAIKVWGPDGADFTYYVARVEYLAEFQVREESEV